MVRDIGDGYVLVTERTLRRFQPVQLDQLTVELERRIREVRADQPDLADTKAVQIRNRRIQRLSTARRILQGVRMKRRA